MSRLMKIVATLACVLLITGCGEKADKYLELSAEQIYTKGKQSALGGNYSEAIKHFDALEAHYPYGKYTDLGQLALIHAYANADEAASALATAERFIRMHPRHPNVDYAYYMKGLVNFNTNYSFLYRNLPVDRSMRSSTYAETAFDDFKTLLLKFPSSYYAYDARQRMLLLREQLAEHELHVAKFYVKQGANLAAANRAGYIINRFPESKSVLPALEIMQDSYTRLKMPAEAKEAARLAAVRKQQVAN